MKYLAIVLAVSSFVLCAVPTIAQHAHDHHHDAPAPPTSYYACVTRAAEITARIESALATKDAQAIDNAGYELLVLAKTLGKAALNESSVPRDKVKEVNTIGKQIADLGEAIHDGAAKFDAVTTNLAALRPLVAKLEKLVPDQFVCRMHCEGKKTYMDEGICPVCKMALTKMSQTPYFAQVSAPGTVEPGKPTRLDIKLLDPAGNLATKIDVVHDYPLHFMIVSEDLSFYAHEHPTRQPDGSFRLSNFTFPFGGKFVAFSDFTPNGVSNQVSQFEFKVPLGGDASPAREPMNLVQDWDNIGKVGDYEFRVRCNGKEFVAGQDSFVRYGIDLKGKPVTDLQPLMGELGHLVAVSKDFKHYIHAHPIDFSGKPSAHAHAHAGHGHDDQKILEKGRELLGNGKPSDVIFHAVFPGPGLYRAFAQFKHQGKELMYPVTIDVQPNPDGSAAPMPAKGGGGGGPDHKDHKDHGGK